MMIFFCSNSYDRSRLAKAIQQLFADCQVLGCTTAGEIGPAGLQQHGLAGVSFSSAVCLATAGLLTNLKQIEIPKLHQFARQQLLDFQAQTIHAGPDKNFGILLIDGLSVREEPVSAALQAELGNAPLVGGSAGDGLRFDRTFVYFNGAFHHDSAALLLINTPLPFRVFKTQHFVPTEERMVVTVADVRRRVVHEINGRPAAEEYARLIGVDVTDLNPGCFAKSPMVVMINGNYYVRSIQRVNPDGSLTFYCAIEEGLVLRVATGEGIVENLRLAFDKVREQIGRPQLTLVCDCILRKLEVVERGLVEPVSQLLTDNNALGFNTYGEQFQGIHVNQTFAAVAIGGGSND